MSKDKMELEEAINILSNKIYSLNENIKIYDKGYDLSNKDKFVKEREAIETVLQALENSIPKKKIEDRLQELLNKLASAGLDGFYDEVKDIEQELLKDK